ncbi:uncharacterized protein LOC132726878 [Ruditapes philippinarum]|uniref:uncharacterized protein LOC132726878 n=1 Tax=Ruditapes philippinarum TaxID=129788 RepID=UPI00295B134B|nr:uncharacterized protein LOC132726878 [Ruditapes philippinarum]
MNFLGLKNGRRSSCNTVMSGFRYLLIAIFLTIIVQQGFNWSISHRTLNRISKNAQENEVGQNYRDKRHRRSHFGHNFTFTTNVKKQMCSDKVKWKTKGILAEVTSDMEYWTFDKRRTCKEINIDKVGTRPKRLKMEFICKNNKISFKWTNDTNNIYTAPFGDNCIERYISSCCYGDKLVPNVVHYVWYSRGELSFVGFMSLLSVIRFVNPCLIIFHGDTLPNGRYWDFIVNISPNLIHLQRERPEFVFGQRFGHNEHSGDIMRIEALLQYGGIYMDTDTVLVRPIDELRQYACVMSTQLRRLGSAFILAEKNATFLQKWMDGYRYKYNRLDYTYNAMTYPQILALKYSNLIHVEIGTASRPKDLFGFKFYSRRYEMYNWSKVYGVHLFTRGYGGPLNETTIRDMHSPCGSVMRHIFYGNKDLCF